MPAARASGVGLAAVLLALLLAPGAAQAHGIWGHVHVTGIRLAGDLAHLRVRYVMEGNDEPNEKAQDVLTQAAGFVARELARSLQLRRVPKVVFTFDDEFVRLRRIRELLEGEQVQADDDDAG